MDQSCVRILLAATGLLLLNIVSVQAQSMPQDDRSSAVVFVYQCIGDDDDSTDCISLQQFKDHIREMRSGGYAVLPLPEIVKALQSGHSLPAHSIGISFDGSDHSIAAIAAPLLIENNIAFTIFIAPGQLSQNQPGAMNWSDIKRLGRNGLVTVGLLTENNAHLVNASDTEIQRQINSAKAEYRMQLGNEPTLFAYPFGEYSLEYSQIVKESGFTAAFGQQAGVVTVSSHMMALPRFSLTQSYGDIDHFRTAADAIALPVTDIEPSNPVLKTRNPAIGFTVDPSLRPQLAELSCFIIDEAPLDLHIVGQSRIEIRLKQPLPPGQARMNCTLPPQPGDSNPPRWRWFGMTMIAPS